MSGTSTRPRILVAAQDFPWPSTGGSLQRLALVINELALLGDVDLFALVHPRRAEKLELPARRPIRRWHTAVVPEPDLRLRVDLRLRWLCSNLPMELAARDFSSVRDDFHSWAAAQYDLVWVSKVTTWVSLGAPRLGPTIIDLDDLEDRKVRTTLDVAASPARSRRAAARLLAGRTQTRLNARRWQRTQRRAAAQVENVTLCSTLDVHRAKLPNAVVVANGYPQPRRPLGRTVASDQLSVLLQGVLYYPPNVDAARWLAHEIAPRLRGLLPAVHIRLVGTAHPPVQALHDPPAIDVVGWVEDMNAELARADVVVVPLRSGSGTRIKILEAFAHRIPVVSTTLGAEGLAAENERHLLVADDADAFAAACVRALCDTELRARMTDAAHTLYLQRHTSSVTSAGVRAVSEPLIARST